MSGWAGSTSVVSVIHRCVEPRCLQLFHLQMLALCGSWLLCVKSNTHRKHGSSEAKFPIRGPICKSFKEVPWDWIVASEGWCPNPENKWLKVGHSVYQHQPALCQSCYQAAAFIPSQA